VVRGSFDFPPTIFVGVDIGSMVVGLVWELWDGKIALSADPYLTLIS